MRIAVVGATGSIGRLTVPVLRARGHEPVGISRSLGVDLLSGNGLDDALRGVEAVIDTTNTTAADPDETVKVFGTMTTNLLAAEQRTGVRHHVLLSIVGVHRADNPHYAGKRAQEELVERSGIPATIVAATQFYDFPMTVAGWLRDGDTVTVPPLLTQPIAPEDVAAILAEVATAEPRGRIEIAGPQTEDLVDMARRSFAARGERVRIVPAWAGIFDVSMAGNVLLPGPGATLTSTTFDEWLARHAA